MKIQRYSTRHRVRLSGVYQARLQLQSVTCGHDGFQHPLLLLSSLEPWAGESIATSNPVCKWF